MDICREITFEVWMVIALGIACLVVGFVLGFIFQCLTSKRDDEGGYTMKHRDSDDSDDSDDDSKYRVTVYTKGGELIGEYTSKGEVNGDDHYVSFEDETGKAHEIFLYDGMVISDEK